MEIRAHILFTFPVQSKCFKFHIQYTYIYTYVYIQQVFRGHSNWFFERFRDTNQFNFNESINKQK